MGKFKIFEVCIVLAINYFVTVRKNTLDLTFRANGQFIILSKLKIVDALVQFISLILLLVDPWYGYLIRWVLVELISYCLLLKFVKMKPASKFHFEAFNNLIKVGAPLFSAWYVLTLNNTINKTIVFKYFDAYGLGVYTPALMLFSILSLIPDAIMKYFSPKMNAIYGRTNSVRSLAKSAFIPMMLLSAGLIPLYSAGYFLIDPFINFVLPDYSEGILAAKLMVVAGYFKSINLTQSVFTVLNKGFLLLGIRILSTGIMIIVSIHIFKNTNMGVEGGVIGLIAGTIFNFAFCTLISIYLIFKKQKPTFKFVQIG